MTSQAIKISKQGQGRYVVRRPSGATYALRYRIDGDNAGLWEVRRDGDICGVELRKRDALRLIEDGVY